MTTARHPLCSYLLVSRANTRVDSIFVYLKYHAKGNGRLCLAAMS